MVKSEDSGPSSSVNSTGTGGHLDALAEAAASATSVLSDLMSTTTPSAASTSIAASPQHQQHQQPTTTTIKYFDAGSKQFTLTSPLLQSPVNHPPANILSNSSNGNAVPTVVTTIPGTTTTSASNKVTTMSKTVRGITAKAKDEKEEVGGIRRCLCNQSTKL